MEHEELIFDALPNKPQLQPLFAFANAVWQRSDVVALWVGGSIARGNADRYSDVDLVVAVQDEALDTWKQPSLLSLFGETVVGYKAFALGEQAFLHHLILITGDIYDVVVQRVQAVSPKEGVLVLGCRDAMLAERLRSVMPEPALSCAAASGEVICEVITDFWFNTHKHRKVLDRGMLLMAQTGIQNERSLLLRLWYVEATGLDCGDIRSQTIFGMTQVMRTVEKGKGAVSLAVMGASLGDYAAIVRAIEQARVEVTKVGRALADLLRFPYPMELEAIVLQGWQEYTRSVD